MNHTQQTPTVSRRTRSSLFRMAIVAGLAVTALTPCASAQNEFNGAVDSDWFNPLNWTDGIPGASDFAVLNAGVSAFAGFVPGRDISISALWIGFDVGNGLTNTLVSEVDMQIADSGFVEVGYSRRVGGSSVGRLDLTNASILGNGIRMNVGTASFDALPGDTTLYADGVVNVTNGDIQTRRLDVGIVFQQGGDASGVLNLTNGHLIATGSNGDLSVGSVVQESPGSAIGEVTITNGSIQNYAAIDVGISGNAGFADGRLSLINSRVSLVDIGWVTLGSSVNTSGVLDLDSSYMRAEFLDLNATGALNMTVNGLTRASDSLVGAGTYSAIDLGSIGDTDGVVNIDLGGLGFTTGATFDLITLDVGSDFSCNQFANVQVLNIAPGMSYSTEYVPGDAVTGGIFRLTVDSALSITGQPVNRIAEGGGPVESFTVAADNATTFQWLRNGVPVTDGAEYSGSTSSTLTVVPSIQTEGLYTCAVSNPDGTVVSESAALVILTPCPADITGTGACNPGEPDGIVDLSDFSCYLSEWSSGCSG